MRRLLPLLLLAAPAAAQDPTMDTGGAVPYAIAAFDVRHYALDLAVDPATRTIGGTATVTATFVQPHDRLTLDLDTVFTVQRVTVGGVARPFEHARGQLVVHLGRTQQPGQTVRATVAYGGAPRVAARAPWDGGFTWGRTPGGQPWIATTVQGEGADLWFPVKDFPSDEADSVALHISVPSPLVVATNGRLRGVDAVAGPNGQAGWKKYRWHVSHPTNNYGLALNIGPYVRIDETYTSITGRTVPFQFYVLPEKEADARRQTPQFLRHIRWFEDTLGPYPWPDDKLGVAHTPHLGMEHQGIIAYGSGFGNDADGFDWLYHHEFAHEYFGNLLTAWDWRDFWIHEGFGSYMQVLYAEHLRGPDGAPTRLLRIANFANALPVAPRDLRSSDQIYRLPGGGSNLDIYYKGAHVLHALRFVMGDDAFFRSLRRFVYPTPEHAARQTPRFVTTDDYLEIVNEEAGRDLSWFFEVYLRQPAMPRLVETTDGGQKTLRWDVPNGLPFPMPIEAAVDGVVRRYDVPASGLVLPAGAVVDPNRWVVRAR